ncbi:MAG: HAD-IIA family hydrolase [Lachnospiraceae bacterium]|nr:HAD-IIA family hydrolase [Robinsoniella sp.]MDY3765602.1 HAD-IIA family hydrolase [Lachnospiraceae bacterium]
MLRDKRLFLFDIDGTLATGDVLYTGSRELLNYIEEIGGKAIYITNNSTKSLEDYVKKFARWDLQTQEWQFVTSGFMAIRYLKEHFQGKKIFVMGTASFVKDLREQGITVVENIEDDIACVLIAYDSELTYGKLERVCEILSTENVSYLATNPDLCCPAPFGFIPDCGSICQMIENSTGKKPEYLGKPAREIVDYCRKITGFSREQTLVVGDRLYTDIACGIAAGVDTCVVYTGEATPKDVRQTKFVPTYEFGNIGDLLKAVKSE